MHENAEKILNKFHVDKESSDEILDAVRFVSNEIPRNFPKEGLRVALKNSRAIQFEDTIKKENLSSTCSYYAIHYYLFIGADGMGWAVHVYDSMGDSHLYKSSQNYLFVSDEYSINNVYEFINSALSAMCYAPISKPIEKMNFIKPKFVDVNRKSPEEECKLGKQYLYGKGEDINLECSFNHFKNSAEQGYGLGMYYLACCYLDGKGTAKNLNEGKKWLLKSCTKNIAFAYERLGQAYDFCGEFGEDEEKANAAFSKAFELLSKDADSGDGEILYHLAMCYNYGHGVDENSLKSIEILMNAVKAGSDDACYELALLYKTGDGVEKSDEDSFKWYQNAAILGNVDAIYEIGYCYESGTGVNKELKKAFEWYMKGAQKNHAYSQHKVGLCFLKGIGTEKNLDNALVFLNLASKQGFEDAKMMVRQLLTM